MTINHYREIHHFHLFCGLGGGAAGFNSGQARVRSMQARFRCLGGIDSDKRAIGQSRFELLLPRLLPVGHGKAARAMYEYTPENKGQGGSNDHHHQ